MEGQGSNGGDGAGSTGGEVCGEEDTESSSSWPPSPHLDYQGGDVTFPVEGASDDGNMHGELETFMKQWREEIQVGKGSTSARASPLSIEDRARDLFLKGVNKEAAGYLGDAIQFYRAALHLVPDIDTKVGKELLDKVVQPTPPGETAPEASGEMVRSERTRNESTCSDVSVEDENLSDKFLKYLLDIGVLCSPEYDQKAAHISCLPQEVVAYIVRWVVSRDLDVRSVEKLSEVCRGFYRLARDPGLWKNICEKVWGPGCEKPGRMYGHSWRRMYVERPHVHCNGCYISQTSYVRYGEASLDNTYRPFFDVTYYRYVRFFSDGQVVMLTTPEDPFTSVPRLRNKPGTSTRLGQGMMVGRYTIGKGTATSPPSDSSTAEKKQKPTVSGSPAADVVSLRLVQTRQPYDHVGRYHGNRPRGRHARSGDEHCQADKIFTMVFQVCGPAAGSGRRQHTRLVWNKYEIEMVYRDGRTTVTGFDLAPSAFPPLQFSRVRSYALVPPDAPLE